VSPRHWLFRITDMLEALAAIQEYTSGLTFEGFVHERKTEDFTSTSG
jgi:uncharacterized protein with HEPN domain